MSPSRLPPSVTTRLLFAAGALLTASLLGAVVWSLRGSMNQHFRPDGHRDVTFAVSPRGDAIVFNAAGQGGRDLYLLDLSNLSVKRIAETPDFEIDPSFSPDGKSVVYAAGRPGDRADHIFVRSLDRPTLKQLTSDDANDESPEFSPDGSMIVFTRFKEHHWGGLSTNWGGGTTYVMRADGTGLRQISVDGSPAVYPRFSPSGKTIVFWSDGGTKTAPTDGSRTPQPVTGTEQKSGANCEH